MRALLDVNVLVALLDSGHASHGAAMKWLGGNAAAGWASCPITQNGCMRILANPSYANPMPLTAVAQRLREAADHPFHEAWPDDVSILDASKVHTSRIHGPRQLTDVYLLALAVSRHGRLVTFDRAFSLDAVEGARNKHLLVI